MNLREFRTVRHWPPLLCAFFCFDIRFMIWVLVGALANAIVVDVPLSSLEKGLLVGIPILGGAILRLAIGLMADRIGARRTAMIGMVLTILPFVMGWLWAGSFGQLLVVGLPLGVAAASFAVGIVLGVFVVFANDSPNHPAPKPLKDYVAVLRMRDTWYLCLFHALTLGGFVGLASFLGIFVHDHYGLSPVQAGALVTLSVIAGSFLRPLGGYLAERFGEISLLTVLYLAASIILLDLATSPPMIWGTILFVSLMGLFGLGNGAVFQLVPRRFPKDIGVVTGIVGAAGGFGGFFLPTLLGGVHQLTGSYSIGLILIAVTAFGCVAALFRINQARDGVFITKEGLATQPSHPAPATELEPEMVN